MDILASARRRYTETVWCCVQSVFKVLLAVNHYFILNVWLTLGLKVNLPQEPRVTIGRGVSVSSHRKASETEATRYFDIRRNRVFPDHRDGEEKERLKKEGTKGRVPITQRRSNSSKSPPDKKQRKSEDNEIFVNRIRQSPSTTKALQTSDDDYMEPAVRFRYTTPTYHEETKRYEKEAKSKSQDYSARKVRHEAKEKRIHHKTVRKSGWDFGDEQEISESRRYSSAPEALNPLSTVPSFPDSTDSFRSWSDGTTEEGRVKQPRDDFARDGREYHFESLRYEPVNDHNSAQPDSTRFHCQYSTRRTNLPESSSRTPSQSLRNAPVPNTIKWAAALVNREIESSNTDIRLRTYAFMEGLKISSARKDNQREDKVDVLRSRHTSYTKERFGNRPSESPSNSEIRYRHREASRQDSKGKEPKRRKRSSTASKTRRYYSSTSESEDDPLIGEISPSRRRDSRGRESGREESPPARRPSKIRFVIPSGSITSSISSTESMAGSLPRCECCHRAEKSRTKHMQDETFDFDQGNTIDYADVDGSAREDYLLYHQWHNQPPTPPLASSPPNSSIGHLGTPPLEGFDSLS